MELDEEQRYVVESGESMVVVSGPGSGKTRVLTERARRLFNKGESLICLCFTRSAAREMASRVPGLPATTIHSYCCGRVGWKEKWGYPGLLYRFLMESDEDRFENVLLDECQDVNPEEMDVVLSLIGDKVFAVGDPYQSIYGFQGAMGPKVIDWLEAMGCEKVSLHNNYRSCEAIVSRLNGIFDRGLISRNIKDTGLTAILCRRNDDVFEASSFLRGVGIAHRVRLAAEVSGNREYDVIGESNLRLCTIHQAKGSEYNHVALFSWGPDTHDDGNGEEMRIYYVALARASKTFVEVSSLDRLVRFLKAYGIND